MKINLKKLTSALREANHVSPMCNLTPLARDILFFIHEREDIDNVIVNDLITAFWSHGSPVTIRNAFELLENEGLVQRQQKPNIDKRIKFVSLTAKGRLALRTYAATLAAAA